MSKADMCNKEITLKVVHQYSFMKGKVCVALTVPTTK